MQSLSSFGAAFEDVLPVAADPMVATESLLLTV